MASCKKKLKVRHAISKAGAGKLRKNALRRNGTTKPNLPLNMPNAHEKAQAEKK